MPVRPLSRAEVRSIDSRAADEFGLSTLVLMENAGRNAAAWLRDRLRPGDRVLIACGPGNNGGDGGVVARHLEAWGCSVRVAWFADRSSIRGDAAVQLDILERSRVDQCFVDETGIDAFDWSADWIVDGLLGTGLSRPVEGLLKRAIEAINGSGAKVLALDLPSGLDADTGKPLGIATRADATVTFVARKIGFDAPGASEFTGEVAIADIGAPRLLLSSFDASRA